MQLSITPVGYRNTLWLSKIFIKLHIPQGMHGYCYLQTAIERLAGYNNSSLPSSIQVCNDCFLLDSAISARHIAQSTHILLAVVF